MISNSMNPLIESRALNDQVSHLKAQITSGTPISPGKYRDLLKQLNSAFEMLQNLKSSKMSNPFVKTQNEGLEARVTELYGNLESGRVKGEIVQIQEESTFLKKGRLTLRAVKKLELHINELEKNCLPSIPDRRVIADAKQTLLNAKAKLEGKPVIKHFDYLAQQKPVQFMDEIQLLPEEVEELYDVARAVYNRDPGAKRSYNKMSENNKRIFQKHVQNLAAIAFDDPLETMQALLATANELVANGEGYPSSDQIDQLFIGLSQLREEETAKEGKIFSLTSQRFLQG